MFKSPNNFYFESNQGNGDFIFKGRIKGERVEATSLAAPELDSIASQLEEIRERIRSLSEQPISAPSETPSAPPSEQDEAPKTPSLDYDNLLEQIREVREQLQSSNIPGLLAQMDELRAFSRAPPVPTVSMQQLTRLQDQVTRLTGQMNTLQDRVSILEGRVNVESQKASSASSTVVAAISEAAGSVASSVVNRAALKLEDMVSPGALYNLRKVSDRGPVKYAW